MTSGSATAVAVMLLLCAGCQLNWVDYRPISSHILSTSPETGRMHASYLS